MDILAMHVQYDLIQCYSCNKNKTYLKLQLQGVDIRNTTISLLIDQVQLGPLDLPLTLGVPEAIGDLLMLVTLGEEKTEMFLNCNII